jgi:hypothetical protein
MPRLKPAVEGNTDVIVGASLVESESNVCLVGDVAHGDRPHAGNALAEAEAVRTSQQPEPMWVEGSFTEVNRPLW